MGIRGQKKDAGSRQLPVRFSGDDATHLDALPGYEWGRRWP